jgi:hypothetical protein
MIDWHHIEIVRDPNIPARSTWTDPGVAAFLVDIFDEKDPRPAREQAQERYAHGGGWCLMDGFSLRTGSILYPGDPPFARLSSCVLPLTGEEVILFDCGFVAIVQKDGSFEVARMD